jgi:stearoyl-CoA desaturase (delta-9 desaturase)
VRFSWWTAGLGVFWLTLCMLSITAGYHRLFSHRTYGCSRLLRCFYLFFGAASGQASALSWSADHRKHHANTDGEEDPYNIRRGFWWAHIGWLLYRSPPTDRARVKDLDGDPLIRFQDRHYLSILWVAGMLLPTLLGALWGDAAGALLVAGFLRLAIQYQATFSINSVAHTLGRRPYSTSVSARDSWVTAILTLGEGYHNYHHRFPADYRNGVRWYQFDPTKWWIWLLSRLGLAWSLRRVPAEMARRAREAVARAKGLPAT